MLSDLLGSFPRATALGSRVSLRSPLATPLLLPCYPLDLTVEPAPAGQYLKVHLDSCPYPSQRCPTATRHRRLSGNQLNFSMRTNRPSWVSLLIIIGIEVEPEASRRERKIFWRSKNLTAPDTLGFYVVKNAHGTHGANNPLNWSQAPPIDLYKNCRPSYQGLFENLNTSGMILLLSLSLLSE